MGSKQFMVRQGDVLIRSVDAVPLDANRGEREDGRLIVARGEVTGHAHAILDVDVQQYKIGNMQWIVAPQGFTLQHEEHAPITVPQGQYEVVIQRQYTPQAAPRPVFD